MSFSNYCFACTVGWKVPRSSNLRWRIWLDKIHQTTHLSSCQPADLELIICTRKCISWLSWYPKGHSSMSLLKEETHIYKRCLKACSVLEAKQNTWPDVAESSLGWKFELKGKHKIAKFSEINCSCLCLCDRQAYSKNKQCCTLFK